MRRPYLGKYKYVYKTHSGDMVIVVGIGHDDTSSNPGRD